MRASVNTVSNRQLGETLAIGDSRDACLKQRRGVHFTSLARDVLEGFSKEPKSISSRWFYDERGSQLFSRIMELPEYYLTARETEILETNASAIAAKLASAGKFRLVELGAGDGQKTQILLKELLRHTEAGSKTEFIYSPIDISGSALEVLCERLKNELPELCCEPVKSDNLEGLESIVDHASGHGFGHEPIALLFLGSSIGNFSRVEVMRFFSELRSRLRPGDYVLTGFDLVKSSRRLVPAYSDSEGVTAEFNYNLLDRMNRELGADFDRTQFRHEAVWNAGIAAMESWLVSEIDQTVTIPACESSYRFRKGEAIHTETSLKFHVDEIAKIARQTGFEPVEEFTDSNGDFMDALWRVEPVLI